MSLVRKYRNSAVQTYYIFIHVGGCSVIVDVFQTYYICIHVGGCSVIVDVFQTF